jgi:hypothetical protein
MICMHTGCHKPPPIQPSPPPADTVARVDTNTTKPPPVDTIHYVASLEEWGIYQLNRQFTFTFDSSKRLVSVLINNYNNVNYDSGTCRLFYNGNSSKPYMIITPNGAVSKPTGPFYYDTTWFVYNSAGQIARDSSFQHAYNYNTVIIEEPVKRIYQYSDTVTTIRWYGLADPDSAENIIREDTIQTLRGQPGQLQNIKTQFFSTGAAPENYGLTQQFTYTNYINPFSRLNIGGTIFSLIYTPATQEILGNSSTKAVWNSNIIPYYIDFFSSTIPANFYSGGFYGNGFLIAAGFDDFTLQITPDTKYPSLPGQIVVNASSALSGDQLIYKFHY